MKQELIDWLTPTERRMKILSLICKKRHIITDDLAKIFNVSNRTIRNDIKYLSLSYPIETISGRYGGGVKIHEEFHLNKSYLNTEEIELLEEIKGCLPERKAVVVENILNKFALCR